MGSLASLRGAALISVLAGAVGSFDLMLHVGRRQQSLILTGLFTVWVLSPFVALVCALVVSKHWSVLIRSALYCVILVLALGSLPIYGSVALGPPWPQPALVFLVVPLASWLLIGIALLIAALISGRLSHRGDGTHL